MSIPQKMPLCIVESSLMQKMSLMKSGWIVFKRSVNKIKLSQFTDYKNNKNKWWPLCCKKCQKYMEVCTLWEFSLWIWSSLHFFFICFSWNYKKGSGRVRNASIPSEIFSSEIIRKIKIFFGVKWSYTKIQIIFKSKMDRLFSI